MEKFLKGTGILKDYKVDIKKCQKAGASQTDCIKQVNSKFMRKLPYSDVLNQINSNFRPDVLKLKYPKATRSNIMNKIFCDWAYKIQNVTEKVMVHLGKEIYKKTKTNNLCLAGGVALNSVANNILLKKTNFKKMFVFPACSDSGVPFGLVLWGYHNLLQGKKRIKFENAYTGKEYLKNDIKSLLRKNDIEFKETNSKEISTIKLSIEKFIDHLHQQLWKNFQKNISIYLTHLSCSKLQKVKKVKKYHQLFMWTIQLEFKQLIKNKIKIFIQSLMNFIN